METLDFMEMEKRKTSGLGILLMLVCAVCLCTGQFSRKATMGYFPLLLALEYISFLMNKHHPDLRLLVVPR